ncbi:hypothetical protein NDU88_000669 [Pleurodeles waltl]|uniref:C-type lectin domain-containing protein n=1 Tax=Pleurodeles waltl TaxID=8319 RepID=A0AAV7PAC3_PLEWA|nr:hypothetical protein NDU88_000669 [Pleurodeles waltl]
MQGEDVYTALDFSLTGGKSSDTSRNVATAFQCSSQRGSTSTAAAQQDMVSHADRCQCSPAQIPVTATLPPGSNVCPEDWVFCSGMCYFISSEYLDWNRSREDCLSKETQLLVIDDHKEMDFINNITRNKNFLWIGLRVKALGGKWTWVNGLVLNQHMFSIHSGPEESSCASTKRGSLTSESCSSKLNWICEMTARTP